MIDNIRFVDSDEAEFIFNIEYNSVRRQHILRVTMTKPNAFYEARVLLEDLEKKLLFLGKEAQEFFIRVWKNKAFM